MSSVPSRCRFFPQGISDTALLIDSLNPRSTLFSLSQISASPASDLFFTPLGSPACSPSRATVQLIARRVWLAHAGHLRAQHGGVP